MSVRVPRRDELRVIALQRSAAAALARHDHAPIGDRTDAVRFEHIQSELDAIAFNALCAGPDLDLSDLELEVTWTFAIGRTPDAAYEGSPASARSHWRPTGSKRRRDAVKERFEQQLQRWLVPPEDGIAIEPICPSDISNFVLSEGLRAFFATAPGHEPVNARVVYRDGSAARDLRLASLEMSEEIPKDGRRALHLTLLSIRHMEMDATADGAWLRNREISLPRQTGQTDELAYQQSIDQLAELTRSAPIELHLYQTGLEPAIVAFYRALSDHHLQRRGYPVCVRPWYWAGGTNFDPGTPWVIA